MDSYRVTIDGRAVEELLATPFPFRRQINQRILKLKRDPRPSGCELLTEPERYRLLVSGWWILYEIDDEASLVTIVGVRAEAT